MEPPQVETCAAKIERGAEFSARPNQIVRPGGRHGIDFSGLLNLWKRFEAVCT
jgi:hypothetical protein